jgi:hypothetical protein
MLLLRLDMEEATFVALKADAGIPYAQVIGSST